MTTTKGVIDPSIKDPHDMFVGFLNTPKVDRRFLLGALPLGLVGFGATSYVVASELDDPGAGQILPDPKHSITGALVQHPYPMIRMEDSDAPFGMRTALVTTMSKCTPEFDLKNESARSVVAAGTLVSRKNRQLLLVSPFEDKWVQNANTVLSDELINPPVHSLGTMRLAGTIMDSKCFFGVMRPGRGKTHKACAALCIRGGIPASFWVRTKDGRESVMLMTDAQGGPLSMDILPLVADPVEVECEVVRVGDQLQLRADTRAYKRI